MAGTHKRVIVCTLPALLLLVLLLRTQATHAQNRTLVFDINDPRNPECPCHKYQKMADDEYRQRQNGIDLQNKVESRQTSIGGNTRNDQCVTRSRTAREIRFDIRGPGQDNKSQKLKKKKPGHWIRKKINRTRLKNARIRKQRPDYSVCYKW